MKWGTAAALTLLLAFVPSANGFPKVKAALGLPEHGLVIAGRVVDDSSPETYREVVKYLTIPVPKREKKDFSGSDVAAIRSLESPLRRQIFEAMAKHKHELFAFPTVRAAEENVAMRLSMIRSMVGVSRSWREDGLNFGYFGGRVGTYLNPKHWDVSETNSLDYSTRPNVTASEAIEGAFKEPYRGDCFGCVQLIMYRGALEAIGAKRFDKLHKDGLQLKLESESLAEHFWSSETFRSEDLVPGDWVYMRNKPDYDTDRTPIGRMALWQGEHALYMGRYDDVDENYSPLWLKSGGEQRFSGMGLYNQSESDLRWALIYGYRQLMRPPYTYVRHGIDWEDVQWERHSYPHTGQ